MVMLSLNPNPPAPDFYFDPAKMGLPVLNSSNNITAIVSSTANANPNEICALEDLTKKVRKPYTITKCRESWTEQEHDKFLEALQLFDRDWKKIEAFVASKTVIQIRSHAQKYFLKVQKNGASEHVPPPRPKRKAAHPYPQKASKNARVASQTARQLQSSSTLPEAGHVFEPDSLWMLGSKTNNPSLSYWTCDTVPPVNVSNVTNDEVGVARPIMTQNCCSISSTESTPRMWPTGETDEEGDGKLNKPVRVLPDFSKVYSFIGSVFDPSESGHLQRLKNMDQVDVQTILLLMKNLCVNLTSPEFEDFRKMLSSYDVDAEEAKSFSLCNNLRFCKPENAIPSA